MSTKRTRFAAIRKLTKMAVALLHGIISSHGFVEGYRRTALYLVELMVERRGFEFVEDDMAVVEVITSVARGETTYEYLAGWCRERLIAGNVYRESEMAKVSQKELPDKASRSPLHIVKRATVAIGKLPDVPPLLDRQSYFDGS